MVARGSTRTPRENAPKQSFAAGGGGAAATAPKTPLPTVLILMCHGANACCVAINAMLWRARAPRLHCHMSTANASDTIFRLSNR